MFIVFISQIVQNPKIKMSKILKELISEFTANYLFNAEDWIHKFFIQRGDLAIHKLEMVIKNIDSRRLENDNMKSWIDDYALEIKVQDICFYNHVISSYIYLISHLLISFDKEEAIKNQSLKRTIQIFQKQIFDILKLCTSNRLTQSKEVFDEFHDFLKNLENVQNIDFGISEIGDPVNVPSNVSMKADLIISPFELQQQSIANYSKDQASTNKSSNSNIWKNLLSNLFGYGRSFCLDRNEIYYTLKICHYDPAFINDFIRVIGRYNLETSLIDSERLLITSVHDIFAFVSSLGHDGFIGSSYDRIPSSIKRAENEINYGFNFFTIV